MNALQTKITRMAMLAVCSAALTAPMTVLAQDTPPPPPADGGGPGGPGGGHHHGGGDRAAQMKEHEGHQLEEMSKKLNLTADQQTQIKQVYADSDAKISALFADTSTSMQEKRPQMMQLMKDREAAVKATLTPQQAPKFDAMAAEMKDHAKQGHKHGGPGGPGGPGNGNDNGDNPPPPPQQ